MGAGSLYVMLKLRPLSYAQLYSVDGGPYTPRLSRCGH